MIREILTRHRNGTLDVGVSNPSLEVICKLVAKAATSVTPNVQCKAFWLTGLTLPVDGSQDHELSPELKKLLDDHGQDIQVHPEDLARFSSTKEVATKPTISKIFQVLCGDAQKLKQEGFSRNPRASSQLKKEQRRENSNQLCLEKMYRKYQNQV